jgi:hypothetical protein
MPLTKLDTTTVLIVIDLQKGILGLLTVHPIGEVVKQAGALADHINSVTRIFPRLGDTGTAREIVDLLDHR